MGCVDKKRINLPVGCLKGIRVVVDDYKSDEISTARDLTEYTLYLQSTQSPLHPGESEKSAPAQSPCIRVSTSRGNRIEDSYTKRQIKHHNMWIKVACVVTEIPDWEVSRRYSPGGVWSDDGIVAEHEVCQPPLGHCLRYRRVAASPEPDSNTFLLCACHNEPAAAVGVEK